MKVQITSFYLIEMLINVAVRFCFILLVNINTKKLKKKMKFTLILVICFVSVFARNVPEKPLLAPLSENIVNYVNKMETTWKVIFTNIKHVVISCFKEEKISKAEVSKYHSWSVSAFKKLLGVPLEYINKPSRLNQRTFDVKLSDLPSNYLNHI